MIPLPSLSPSLGPIGDALDRAAPEARVNWMRGLSGGELRALWRLAEVEPQPLSLDELIAGEGEVVIHHGKNSLPFFCNFEKRLVRRSGAVQGYNHNPRLTTAVIGPGHFTARQESEDVVLFDYIALPADVPVAFPPLVGNDRGLSRLVFGGMQDRVRRVSSHCTIGRAWKAGKAMSAWFMLSRDPAVAA